MGYDINLKDPVTHEVIELDNPHFMRGGTYAVNGTHEAWLNITYNYADWYYKDGVFPNRGELVQQGDYGSYTTELTGIRSIYGLSGAESIPILKHAIQALEAMIDDISAEEKYDCEQNGITGYWLPTRTNAIKPLYSLLAMAQMRPDGIWDGD